VVKGKIEMKNSIEEICSFWAGSFSSNHY